MPSKRRKYNARFPAGRIKKIMQTDEEVGKVAQAVPIIISRTLELFVESLLQQTMRITSAKNAKTLSPSHMKQCIISERRFDFLKDLVKSLPDVNTYDDETGGSGGNDAEAIESPTGPDASNQALTLGGFSGPRHSYPSDSTNSKTPRQKRSTQKTPSKTSSKEETESDDSESENSEKADMEVGNNSDFVIDEDYDA